MSEPVDYAQKVYAAVLGKVIGVYLGRPFESWTNERIERELGEIRAYVHERLGKPLVVSDDDISGTLTFLRALADHDAWRNVTSEQIGQTWLNYLIEPQTVLWWGGMGISTEHTAYLRLAAGVPAPRSGSMELNGRLVAEQIGAQIFIDGWALVAPNDPALAAELAGRAGRVSHDGESVYAAQAVAAMESAAFSETNMDKLFEVAAAAMPADCLIAQVHRDVRAWVAEHGDDWRATFRRIQDRYGYDRYGGGWHVVPNHAVMVMAWAHAPADFDRAMMIVNTAGWDTDCNAGNVGCLMGLVVGLEGMGVAGAGADAGQTDWQAPFADRVVVPTAFGGTGISDVLREADRVADYGRRVMGWPARPAPKSGARFHFSMPGARHGFMADGARLENRGGRLRIELGSPSARVLTPTFIDPGQGADAQGSYRLAVCPTLFSGQTVRAAVSADRANASAVSVRLVATRYVPKEEKGEFALADLAGEPIELAPGAAGELAWAVPAADGFPVASVGLEVSGGSIELDWMDWSGAPCVDFTKATKMIAGPRERRQLLGWIGTVPMQWRESGAMLLSNRGVGLTHTGDEQWTDYAVTARLSARLADAAGVLARYRGVRRYVALLARPGRADAGAGRVELVQCRDGRSEVLASAAMDWLVNEQHELKLEVRGGRAKAFGDGQALFEADLADSAGGGIGLRVDDGSVNFHTLSVEPV